MSISRKEYLKKYQSAGEEDKQSKKTKKKRKVAAAAKVPAGVIIVDNDAAWQKNIDEDLDEPEVEGGVDGPQVIEDVEVKRMHQIERIKQHRPYMSIGDDGSGWTTVDTNSKNVQQKVQREETLHAGSPGNSPPRRRSSPQSEDISPPRKRKSRADTPDVSPPRRIPPSQSEDISPPRKRKSRADSPDVSLPRRIPPSQSEDISPPRKRNLRIDSSDMSPLRRKSSGFGSFDASPPRRKPTEQDPNPSVGRRQVKMTDGRQAGLITNKAERAAELAKKKQEDARRLKEMDGGGRAAETVYRDKRGKRLEGLEELLKQQQGEIKPEAKPLEWGKGLAQKREVAERHAEFEAEKNKPFARSRDDPELDKVMKDRLRWGDPMAHLVKRKDPAAELVDLGGSEEMKESGFIIPQDIPRHSWLKRGVGAPMNRYGIKPGRHWDGVDRSTGFENQMFKAKAEKQATEMEAYLWSVADM